MSNRVDKIVDHLRGGGSTVASSKMVDSSGCSGSSSNAESSSLKNPFHLAFPVHDLEKARHFYGTVLGCPEGRSAPEKWIDYNLFGHQIVAHFVGEDYKANRYYNPVDGDEVPVAHFGAVLSKEEFHGLAERLKEHNVKFVVEPHLRFQGAPGEQWTMFFYDPSGNALEFKAMAHPENLFAKYLVHD